MLTGLLRAHLRPYRRTVAVASVLQVVEVVALLLLPTTNAAVINDGVVSGDPGVIASLGALMLLVAVVAVVAGIASVSYGARAALGLSRDLRSAVFRRVLELSDHQVGRFGGSSLVTRTINDVQQIERLVLAGFTTLAAAPLTCLGSVVLAVNQDVPLSAVPVALIPVMAVLTWVVLIRMGRLYARIQPRVELLNRILGEQISGVRTVRAFVRDDYELARFRRTDAELFRLSLGTGRLMATLFPAVMLVSNLATVAIVWFGGLRVGAGAVRIGTVNAFVEYLVYIVWSIMLTTFVFITIPRAAVSARRIREVLDTEPEVTAPSAPAAPPPGAGRGVAVELRGVEFRYPGAARPALSAVDLSAGPGETVAIVGSTGSGKTTLLNLVLRLADTTAGSVLVDGTDVRDLDPGDLTRTVGLVPQRALLFSGTVADNLRHGRPRATEAELWHALEVAQAAEFVARLEGGLDAPVAQGGATLSGGQRQRLTIARTLLRRPAVYLFDDCFSALDATTEADLRAALAVETAAAAVLVVAQRVDTVRDADRIVVLDEGRVVGSGRHEELLAGNEAYREIVSSQPVRLVAP
ncbi:ABC transporter ATP-binding protein [Actinophytocola xanthii]|uniref:Multidrug ABC transporter ATP-binding protein n=1 Tax=Actinophytocola xanthii TaxID=1912961 RepID=A0A1Q8CS48_9PSEU|nr:ABC transporter ATP-binding protein [Actinophytocola xanthii]OLF17189.1 multidrug ABC transporter ATP-binding protein [Actinophytocola xanthii]